MIAGPPRDGEAPIPGAIAAMIAGDRVRPFWRHDYGGLTFEVTGRSGRRFVKQFSEEYVMLAADLPTCRPADLPTCRPADLPTCRPADLPTCRPADLPDAAEVPAPASVVRLGAAPPHGVA